jgi:transcriptional/translational regulatory protein YebC/TACO1
VIFGTILTSTAEIWGRTAVSPFCLNKKDCLSLRTSTFPKTRFWKTPFSTGIDIDYSDEAIEITTTPSAFSDVRDALTLLGYRFASAGIEFIPNTYTKIDDPNW